MSETKTILGLIVFTALLLTLFNMFALSQATINCPKIESAKSPVPSLAELLRYGIANVFGLIVPDVPGVESYENVYSVKCTGVPNVGLINLLLLAPIAFVLFVYIVPRFIPFMGG